MVAFSDRFKKGKGKAKPKMTPRPKTTLAQKVNSIIARNVENKITLSYNNVAPICVTDIAGGAAWYLLKDWNTKLFTISQGASVQQRIGNQIKLKRWVIRGQIAPSGLGNPNAALDNTLCGTVDVYFGRLLNNNEISSSLIRFYENGSSSNTPNGAQSQIFSAVNKDEYKVYYHKKFKLSPAQNIGGVGSSIVGPNNDFALVRTFGFDVTKLICKNAIIKYSDSDNDPNHDMIRRLALWAVYTPAIGDMGTNSSRNHFYQIALQSYAEYEDA